MNAIAKSGGFFFTELLDNNDKKKFLKYLRGNDLADVISRSLKNEFGYLLKIRDDIISRYYPYDARKKTYYQTLADSEKQRGSRFHVSDFKLYHSFIKYSVWKKYFLSIIPKNEEKSFFLKYNVPDHKIISKSICYAYDYSSQKVVVVVMDFDKSLKSILNIVEFFNDDRYRMIIATLKPVDLFEGDLYRKINNKTENIFRLNIKIEVTAFKQICNFFGV